MPIFELLTGTHDEDGTVYRRDPKPDSNPVFVESFRDLAKMFVNKFRRVNDATPATAGEKRAVTAQQQVDRENAAKRHADAGGRGAVPIPHAPHGAAQTAGAASGGDGKIATSKAEGDTDPNAKVTDESGAKETVVVIDPIPPKGADVTDQFPKAVDQDLVVMKDGKDYTVYDKDDLKKPGEPKPLADSVTTKKDVEAIIAKNS